MSVNGRVCATSFVLLRLFLETLEMQSWSVFEAWLKVQTISANILVYSNYFLQWSTHYVYLQEHIFDSRVNMRKSHRRLIKERTAQIFLKDLLVEQNTDHKYEIQR